MNLLFENRLLITRRYFFGRTAAGIGGAALASLLQRDNVAQENPSPRPAAPRAEGVQSGRGPEFPNFAPRAKRVIYLFQSGAPSQMDLFDYKPKLHDLRASELPASIRKGQRLTGMTSTQASFPVAPSIFKFAQHGQCGAWVSNLMPHTARMVDDL